MNTVYFLVYDYCSGKIMDPLKNLHSKVKNIIECPICFETFSQPLLLPCLHSFCSKCLIGSSTKECETKESLCCPLCRKNISGGTDYLPINVLLENLVDFGKQFGPIDQQLKQTRNSSSLIDHLLWLRSQASDSKNFMDRNLNKIRLDVDEAKRQLQQKLDDDYKLLQQQMNEIEANNRKSSSYYQSLIDDLLSDLKLEPHVVNGNSKNPFHNSNVAFHPRNEVSNLKENTKNSIGEIQLLPTNGSAEFDIPSKSPAKNLTFVGSLVTNDSVQTKTTVGVALTQNYICTVQVLTQVINLFSISSLELSKTIQVPNLRNPQDMCSCPGLDRLYVADSFNDTLHMIGLGSDAFSCWPLSLEPTNISCGSEKRVTIFVACARSDGLLEIDGETGKQIRKFDLQSQILGVSHVLSLGYTGYSGGLLVLCHGVLMSDSRHQVLVMDRQKGRPISKWCFGGSPSSGMESLNHPSYMSPVVNPKTRTVDSILVADQSNNRIVQLRFPSLAFRTSFSDYDGVAFKNPCKVLHDSSNRLVIVVENDSEGNVLVFKSDF